MRTVRSREWMSQTKAILVENTKNKNVGLHVYKLWIICSTARIAYQKGFLAEEAFFLFGNRISAVQCKRRKIFTLKHTRTVCVINFCLTGLSCKVEIYAFIYNFPKFPFCGQMHIYACSRKTNREKMRLLERN